MMLRSTLLALLFLAPADAAPAAQMAQAVVGAPPRHAAVGAVPTIGAGALAALEALTVA